MLPLTFNKVLIGFFISVLLFILFIPFSSSGSFGIAFPVNVLTWMAILILFILSFVMVSKNSSLKFNTYSYYLLVIGLLLSIPIIWSRKNTDLFHVMLAIYGLIFFFLILQQSENKKSLIKNVQIALVASAIIACISGLLQKYSNFHINYSYVTLLDRPKGPFLQPNVLASFVMTGYLCAIFLLFGNPKRNVKLLCITCVLLCPTLMFLAESRIGWLSAIVCLPFALAALFFKRPPHFFYYLLVVIGGVAIGAAWYFLSVQQGGVVRNVESVSNVSLRIVPYKITLDLILNQPITGYGYNAFRGIFFNALSQQPVDVVVQAPRALSHPHNEALNIVFATGVFGLAAIGLFIYMLFISVFKSFCLQRLQYVVCAGPILMHSMTEYPFYHSVIHSLLLLFFLWAMLPAIPMRTLEFPVLKKTSLIVACLPSVIGIVYLSFGLHTINIINRIFEEPDKRLQYYNQIINPYLPANRVQYSAVVLGLVHAPSLEHATFFIAQAEKFLAYYPVQGLFEILIVQYDNIGNLKRRDELQAIYDKMYSDKSKIYGELEESKKSA